MPPTVPNTVKSFKICVDGLYEFQIYLLHFIKNIWVGSLFIKTGLSPLYVIEMIIKFCVSLVFLLNFVFLLKFSGSVTSFKINLDKFRKKQ